MAIFLFHKIFNNNIIINDKKVGNHGCNTILSSILAEPSFFFFLTAPQDCRLMDKSHPFIFPIYHAPYDKTMLLPRLLKGFPGTQSRIIPAGSFSYEKARFYCHFQWFFPMIYGGFINSWLLLLHLESQIPLPAAFISISKSRLPVRQAFNMQKNKLSGGSRTMKVIWTIEPSTTFTRNFRVTEIKHHFSGDNIEKVRLFPTPIGCWLKVKTPLFFFTSFFND